MRQAKLTGAGQSRRHTACYPKLHAGKVLNDIQFQTQSLLFRTPSAPEPARTHHRLRTNDMCFRSATYNASEQSAILRHPRVLRTAREPFVTKPSKANRSPNARKKIRASIPQLTYPPQPYAILRHRHQPPSAAGKPHLLRFPGIQAAIAAERRPVSLCRHKPRICVTPARRRV